MKSIFLNRYTLAFGVFILIFISSITSAHATVGGPTQIGYFKYNKTDESVYYIVSSASGRGCPPLLQKISLVTEKIDDVINCDEGERLRGSDQTNDGSVVMDEIVKRTQSFKDLTQISLPKNNIEIDINLIRTEKETYEDGSEWVIMSHFLAKVYQNNVQIDEFPITGCNLDQPFTLAGYAIPGFEKKILLLSSAKNDCFEGGYTFEQPFIVNGLTSLDTTFAAHEHKAYQRPLVPSEFTRVVFEKDSVIPMSQPKDISATSTTKTSVPISALVIITMLALALGLLLGRSIGKKV